MTLTDLYSLTLVVMFVAFLSLCFWAFSGQRRREFEQAARLPFADERANQSSVDSDTQPPSPQSGIRHDSGVTQR